MTFQLSIRSSITILAAVCLVPASTVALGVFAYSYHQHKRQMLENSLTTTRTISYLVDKHFSNVESTLHALATSPSLVAGDLPAFYWQAKEALLTQKIANIVLTAPDGTQVMNTLRPFGAPLPGNLSNIRVSDFGATDSVMVSNLFAGKVASRPVIAVAVPVRRSGQNLYGLSGGMSPDVFDAMLREQRLPAPWITGLIDRNGTVVARIGGATPGIGQPISARLRAALADADEGTFEGSTPEGVPTYAAFKRSAATGWTVVIGIPQEYVTGQLRRVLSGVFFAILAVVSAAVVVARLLGRRIAGAISALTAPATALGEGRKVTVAPLGLAEADKVGKALVRASEMLERARHQATHDPLTGLGNRALFHEIVMQQLAVACRTGAQLAVLYIDLDKFKPVNDQHGHAAGDRLLVHVAQQLRGSLRDSDFAARLGGDEFAVVLAGTGADHAAAVAAKILDGLCAPLDLGQVQVRVGASVGIACYPTHGRNLRELLHAADTAMYEAKSAGANRAVLAGPAQEATRA